VGCRVQGAGCRVQGAGCRVQGEGLRVYGLGSRAYRKMRFLYPCAEWPAFERNAVVTPGCSCVWVWGLGFGIWGLVLTV
jgi:hypothetical protein